MRTFTADLLNDEYKIASPFTALISGSSGAGKTTFIKNLLLQNKIDFSPRTIYYHYPPELTSIPVMVRVPEYSLYLVNNYSFARAIFPILDSGISFLMLISNTSLDFRMSKSGIKLNQIVWLYWMTYTPKL